MDGLNRMIGVSSSSAASFHMDHMMQALSSPCRVPLCLCPPTYTHSLLDPRWPEGSSPQAGVVPAGTAESLAKEGGMDGWRDGGREGGREGILSDLENTVNSPQPPSSPSYPLSILTLPHMQTDSPAECVYMCPCTCHLSPYWRLAVKARVREKVRQHMCVFSYGPTSVADFVQCVSGCVGK